MDDEIWRIVPSLPEYEASSWGRIRRIPYEAPMPYGGKRTYGGQAWYGTWTETEPRPIMRFRGKNYRISKLVCEAFHGPAPFPKSVVMHKDDNPQNNKETNLKWGTQKENLNTDSFISYCKSRIGENNPYIKGRK